MEQKELITVIVPAYNVEKYLAKCLDSLLCQTYQNMEILVVDDYSTDHTYEIGQSYEEKDKRVSCIRYDDKGHSGLSAARNCGLERAGGEYIAFVDSDDFVEENYIEILYRNIIAYDADISVCCYEKIGEKEEAVKKDEEENIEICTGQEMLKGWYRNHFWVETVVWNKLYRKKIFESNGNLLRFEDGVMFEDVEFSPKAVLNAQRIVLSSKKLYWYVQRKSSIMGSSLTLQKVKDHLWVQNKRMLLLRDYDCLEALQRVAVDYEKYCIRYWLTGKKNEQSSAIRELVKSSFVQEYKTAVQGTEISIRDKIILHMFRLICKKG